jgi:hypothetical protein
MMSKKKKIAIITTVVLLSFVVIGTVYALMSDSIKKVNPFTIGSVEIKDLNLQITKSNGSNATVLEPADIDTVSWTTENIGRTGVLTRHTLEIYWEEDVGPEASSLLYLYPANMSKEAILTDFAKVYAGQESQYLLKTEAVSKTVGEKTKHGIKYQFVGDALNGKDNVEVSNEVNYNSDTEEIIDSTITTDDTSKTTDSIAFRLLVSPKTSYLFQGKSVSITVTTEAMQYTESGSATWTVVDTQTLP